MTITGLVVKIYAMDDETLTAKYEALVARIRAYPMSEAARARILAEVERAYRAELPDEDRTGLCGVRGGDWRKHAPK